MEEHVGRKERTVGIDILKLENAAIIYDQSTDTLHINITDEEADEVVMLENNIIVRIKGNAIIGLSVQGISRYSR